MLAIGDAIKLFYGDEAGNKLTALLKEHILGAVDVLKAAKTGDKAKLGEANKTWYANADDIAAFLNKCPCPAGCRRGMKMAGRRYAARRCGRADGGRACVVPRARSTS